MSAPTKPFAYGPGVLLGIIILWAAALGLFWVGVLVWKMLTADEAGA